MLRENLNAKQNAAYLKNYVNDLLEYLLESDTYVRFTPQFNLFIKL